MSDDGRFCSECRTEIPRGERVCPACGVFAGDVYDGKTPGGGAARRILVLLAVMAIVGAAGFAAWTYRDRLLGAPESNPPELPSTRVVKDRPGGAKKAAGAKLSQAEAVRVLRRSLIAQNLSTEPCLAVMGRGERGSIYTFTAYDSCKNTSLGRWRVAGETVTRDR